MASKSKPKRLKKKLDTRPKRRAGRAKSGAPVTTDMGPNLARMRVVGKDLPEDGLGVLGAHQIEAGMISLARGTDALVTKVVNSAREGSRDPADHLLDLSRAYYQEETSEGQHNVQCDRCLLKSPGMGSKAAASRVAEALGWVVNDDFDHCPVCKDGGLLLPGASTALAVPPALTPAEMILVVRMRYIVDKIARGASVDAFLQNAIRSQHRSMLSDLAQETNYDTGPLIEKVTLLVGTRGVDVHALFLSDAGKIWSFFLKLYAVLKKEDLP